MKKREKSMIIDPVAMNIVNRIAPGSRSMGSLNFSGGLLLQGEHRGELLVDGGPLVIYEGAGLYGNAVVKGDVYVFSQIGEPQDTTNQLTVMGTLHLASKAVVYGTLRCVNLATYDGAKIHGVVETIPAIEEPA